MKQTSRREFLKLAGKGMLGAAALSTVPAMLPALAEGAEAPAWPWAYKKMDKEAVLKHGYECFYSHGGCCAGAGNGLPPWPSPCWSSLSCWWGPPPPPSGRR